MTNHLIGVYGASGYGREVIPLVKKNSLADDRIVFIDDNISNSTVNGYEILSFDDFINYKAKNKSAVIAIANNLVREKLVDKLSVNNINLLNVVADNVVIMDEAIIGQGHILSPFVTITSNIKVGCHFQANIYSYVAHDCVIGDFVTFAPSVKCNGNVHIEDHAYIGTGAVIKQGTPDKPLVIGKGAVIGMGAIVTKSVKPGDVVFGNPARSLKRDK